jgi:hypothetical protein
MKLQRRKILRQIQREQALDRLVPQLAIKALKAAQLRAMKSGLPVVVAEGDVLIRIDTKTGERTVLKQLEPSIKVTKRRFRARFDG